METKETVGVIVGRFQAESLHPGWRSLIDRVRAKHAHILIAVGVHGGLRTKRDPLTYPEVEYMLREAYPDGSVVIKMIRNHPFSNKLWSRNLDTLIKETFPDCDAILYDSRKGFTSSYGGEFRTETLPEVSVHNGTQLREKAQMPTTKEGRAAIIYSQQTRPDFVYSTVDFAIVDKATRRVLLITKSVFDGLWSFPGGFIESSSKNDLEDTMREYAEEILGISVGGFTCLTPDRIQMNDPRYRDSSDGTRTTLYIADYIGGDASGGDDAEGAQWFSIEEMFQVLVPWHKPLGEILAKNLK